MIRQLRRAALLAAFGALLVLSPPVAAQDGFTPVHKGDDVEVPVGEPSDALLPQAADPLGLLPGLDTLRDHSLGPDVLDVWACGVAESASSLADELEQSVGEYFDHHSRGWYIPRFLPRGYAGSEEGECLEHSVINATPEANGVLHVIPAGGGAASPGDTCGYTPCRSSTFYADGNRRIGFIGNRQAFHSTAAHEMGHMLQWPHSYTGLRGDSWRAYDNALDLMSGNWGIHGGNLYGSHPDPYETAVINLYAAGWIAPSEVYVFTGDGHGLNLATASGRGYRMAVIEDGGRFYTLGARIPSEFDPIPAYWSGVEVYEVEPCGPDQSRCLTSDEMLPGFRRVKPHPPESFEFESRRAYEEPLPHVIPAGESVQVAGVRVEVGEVAGQSVPVSIGSDPQPLPDPPSPPRPAAASTFGDVSDHEFFRDVEWLADSAITRGCNPPVDSRFCPNEAVTRAQMAAFLHRAVPGLPTASAIDFRDDDGSVFESDIEWLSAAGVTRGCNPPRNDRFCPDEVVTRAQMAAFLARALSGLEGEAAVDFADDNGSVFESDIEWLAATGVTRGCNPPDNDRFCPHAPVTRGAMAAFLHRALGQDGPSPAE